jgi:hypothetical protein
MTVALYGTIWMALALFAVAEAGTGHRARHHRPAVWARPAALLGAVLATVHIVLALAIRYRWDHDAAVIGTARQAADLYGFEWRGSIYVSYVFVLVWFALALRPETRSTQQASEPGGWIWLWRGFALIVIANGAIVFAHGPWRALGAVIVGILLWAWWPSGPPRLRRWSRGLP